jgi:hypothetical protein
MVDFWKTMANSLSSLDKTVCQILTALETSTSVERSFNAESKMIFLRQSNSSSDVVN